MTDTSTSLESDDTDPPSETGLGTSVEDANAFLANFGKELIPDADQVAASSAAPARSPETIASISRARDAYWVGEWDAIAQEFDSDQATPESRAEIVQFMLCEDGGQQGLAENPEFAARLLAQATPEMLDESGVFRALAAGKDAIVLDAFGHLIQQYDDRDPEVFERIAFEIPSGVWNGTDRSVDQPKRWLAPRICAQLWAQGGVDEVLSLIELGVDTTTTVPATVSDPIQYSGFVPAIQHIIQDHLADIPKLNSPEAANWDDRKRLEVEGAEKVFATLERTGQAVTATSWTDVKGSKLIESFARDGGTIWGFEQMRVPYVQAAHETGRGIQPVRMKEVWEAVKPILMPDDYAALVANPEKKIPDAIAKALKEVSDEFDTNDKYAPMRRDRTGYLEAFEEAATRFLTSFAQQIPKGSFARRAMDVEQTIFNPVGVIDVAGVNNYKFMGTVACRAGLWAAKEAGEPVYYCLDGINMNDVCDYKTVRNRAIEEFLAEGGHGKSKNQHSEVITMQEVREVLKSWDDLKGTVKLCIKGRILEGDELEEYVAKWQQKMQAADSAAGRPAAPPRASFANELAAIDKKLNSKLDKAVKRGQPEDEVDKDARDIVRKAGYVVNMSNTRPQLVVKYLLSKCGVLFDYELLPAGLMGAATDLARLAQLDPADNEREVKALAKTVALLLEKAAGPFRKPLAAALVRHPLIEQAENAKKLRKMAV